MSMIFSSSRYGYMSMSAPNEVHNPIYRDNFFQDFIIEISSSDLIFNVFLTKMAQNQAQINTT